MKSRNVAVGVGSLLCSAGLVVGVSGVAHAETNTPSTASATAAKSVPGNNGTLKIHELGTPAATPSNDPKVCKFNFEYFGQDAGQEATSVVIKPQGKDTPTTATLTIPIYQANGKGYSQTNYINANPNGETDDYYLPAGHYKATVMDKFGHLSTDKAKSKVFKVTCTIEPPTSTSTTTPPPTSNTSTTSTSSTSSTSTPSTSTSKSTPPTSTSTTPPPTSTTSTMAPPASTSTPPASSTGPVVVTDGPSGGSSGPNSALLGGGLGAAGLALLGYGLLRRRMSE